MQCLRECVRLVRELGMEVAAILLPTFAYEHKVFVGPFSRKFPKAQARALQLVDTSAPACIHGRWLSRLQVVRLCVLLQVYVAPEQWSFPVSLPLPFLGIFSSIAIRPGGTYPWSAEFDHRVLTVKTSEGAAHPTFCQADGSYLTACMVANHGEFGSIQAGFGSCTW